MDLKLPVMDGMQILSGVHRSHASMPILIMTGYATVQNAVAAMKQRAFDYLTKPFAEDQLTLTVTKAIENKRLEEPTV